MQTRTSWLCVAALTALLPGAAQGQAIPRPADERPQLEEFEGEDRPAVPLRLPPPPIAPPTQDRLAAGLTVFVREIRVEGSTVFTSDELERVTRPWTNRSIDTLEVQDVVDAVTALYVQSGFVSSGASVPDQDLEADVLVIRVVETKITDIVIQGNRWYRTGYLRSRLRSEVPAPVNVQTLEEQLQLLLQEPSIRRVNAELRPGRRRGENVLFLAVEESSPFGLRFRVANDSPPGVGSVRGGIHAEHRSVLGFGDRLEGWFDFTDGLDSQEIRYAVPIEPHGTELGLRFRRTSSSIVENPFDSVDIESDTWTVGMSLRHPLVRTPSQQLWIGISGERRQSTTYLEGSRFSFVPGPENGRSKVSVLRAFLEWTWRSRTDVIAARSTASWGLDVLGATKNPGGVPDGRFFSWLAQVQWAHRFPERLLGAEIVVRGDLQLANDPLLSLEQIGIGGSRTVRGYRENLLVRDNAAIGSVELRIPAFRQLLGANTLKVAIFSDVGRAANDNRTRGLRTIGSAGAGLRYTLSDRIQAHAYWAHAFRDVETVGSNIQDDGFHLEVTFRAF